MKSLLRAAVTSRPMLESWNLLRPPSPCIINLHRFALPRGEGDPTGEALSGDMLRQQLAALRRNGFTVVPLLDLIERCASGDFGGRRLAITIDDGYADFDEVGAPIFAEFDCPVTVFLVSGFLDGQTWCWWDYLTEVFLRTSRRNVTLEVAGKTVSLSWTSQPERLAAAARLNHLLERVTDADKWTAIRALATLGEVELSLAPPSWCRPMSWDVAREWEKKGVRFAPHTVSHPILSQTDAAQCREEIENSWRRIREELDDAMPVFAYPNGKDYAVGPREASIVMETGMTAGVTTERRCLGATDFDASRALTPYLLPRHSMSDSVPGLLQVVSGLEDAKAGWRRRRS